MTGFPITLAAPREHHGPLPDAVDVTVIGGGIIGLMAAWALARESQRVLLCEKGRMAGEQSGRNWGWVRQQGRDLAELPMMIDALRLWRDLPPGLRQAAGFRQTGITYLARTEAQLAAYQRWLDGARPHGVDTVLLSRRQTETMLPNAAGWIGALHTPSDGQAEPLAAVPALARAAAADGVTIREGCAVRGLHLSAGQVAGVETEAGPVRCTRVILAAGAWSALFLRAHGLSLPQLAVTSSVSVTGPLPELLPGAAADDRFAIRRRGDGGYTLTPWSRHEFHIGPAAFRHLLPFLPQFLADPASTRFRMAAPKGFPDAWRTPRRWRLSSATPFETCRILDPQPDRRALDGIRRCFADAFPDIGLPPIGRTWAGMIDVTPDSLPVIDHAPIPGLIVATGMSGHGFGIGPGVAGPLADLAMGRAPRHDLSAFRWGRFGRFRQRPSTAI
ncbi:NAD(P)/FAD-dependent oxidoreductase [Paracoccus luteus]|uniref:NAD(P)/FAD-dependent oxidoreductase n=1 Tax=Paracoccus luteus TaxID=2508543 RepID=UPI00106F594A|nr:FAD-dependent oxidoreductase [Paracoccus luteus]